MKRSLEEAARDLRHSLLRGAARERGAAFITLGHTQDDVIETLLMRTMQGSDVHGLRGIPARRGPFLRPMLGCSRAQVLAYLDSLGQPWREDVSNRDTRFLRNRVRHRLLPVLDAEFPGFRSGLIAMAGKLSLASDLVRAQGEALLWKESGTGYTIDAHGARGGATGRPRVVPPQALRQVFPGAPRPAAPVAVSCPGRPLRRFSRGGDDPPGPRGGAVGSGPGG